MSTPPAPEPQVIDVAGATTAVVRGVVPVSELAAFFDQSFTSLTATISAQGVAIASPAFGLYHA